MFDRKEFDDYILDKCKAYVQTFDPYAEYEFREVSKINGSYQSLSVKFSDLNAGPQINLDELYADYSKGASLQEITKWMEDIFEVTLERDDLITESLTFLTDYNKSKEHLFIRVCDQKKNEEYLKHIVYMPLNGLACTYSVYSTIDENGMSSIQITNRMLSRWGITKEQLHEDALKNMQNIFPPRLFSLTDVVMNIVNDTVEEDHIMIDEPLDCDLYCLTNSRKMNGASYICDEQLMEDIGERFGENYYILPSSLHEVILVPETIGDDVESLQEIVRTVNETTVDERDFLSDDIMLYDIVERKLLPVMAEERKETKTMENDDFKREKTMRFTL